MKYITLANNEKVSQEILGLMRIQWKGVDENGNKTYLGLPVEDVEALIFKALDLGINFIDTADIYGHGLSEELIGKVFERNPGLREKLFVQTKCGVVSTSEGRRNSTEGSYIIECVNRSLERLKTDHIDSLLLHMPDALFDPQDVAEAFDQLYNEGKVRYFGVSNWTSSNIALLMKYSKQPITFDQEQLSIVHSFMVDGEMSVNQDWENSIERDTQKLAFCRLNGIQLQAYSTVVAKINERTFIDNPNYEKMNQIMDRLCEKYNTNKNAIALAWIQRLPENVMTVIGTTKVSRLEESTQACDVRLTAQEWYDLYYSTGKKML
ncbi:MAG: aldo/keto reductase [Erysipelotrichaceae bacterium]|nr:aldo/keto reductase [Erysipelotrichaceae bacterium]